MWVDAIGVAPSPAGPGGRKRRRRRIAAGLASAAAVAVVIVAVPLARASQHRPSRPGTHDPAALTCTEHGLTLPGGAPAGGTVMAGDPTGRYLAGNVNDTPGQFVIWDHGRPTLLTVPATVPPPPPEAGRSAFPADIAPDGTAVGFGEWNRNPWIYSHGTFAKLARLPGFRNNYPAAIGDQGTIGGNVSNDAEESYPIVWRTATSPAVRLPLPGPSWEGGVVDVDADGTIVGNAVAGSHHFRDWPPNPLPEGQLADQAVVWRPDGSFMLLPAPPGLDDVASVNAVSIRHGVIVVDISLRRPWGFAEDPYLYELATGRYVALPGAEMHDRDPSPIPLPTDRIIAGNGHGWLLLFNGGGLADLYTPDTGRVRLPTIDQGSGHDVVFDPRTLSADATIIGGRAHGAAYLSCR